mmetsp:Transcript_49013/g.95836  ORF Transcript_49013/g.95836 Transcript_49013/m.95836 type:complete len:159 (+) Transcript_49013:2653-3129(+)
MQSKIDLAARPTSACASETDSVASSMTTNSRFNVAEQFRRTRRASFSERLHPQERPWSSPEIHNDRNKEFRRIQGSFSDGRIVLSSERNKDSHGLHRLMCSNMSVGSCDNSVSSRSRLTTTSSASNIRGKNVFERLQKNHTVSSELHMSKICRAKRNI